MAVVVTQARARAEVILIFSQEASERIAKERTDEVRKAFGSWR